MPAASKPVATNDEVARILQGLKLDKEFFLSKIRKEPLEQLMPKNTSPVSTPLSPTRSRGMSDISPSTASQDGGSSPANRRMRRARTAKSCTLDTAFEEDPSEKQPQTEKMDFDIYLNEALMPTLAQAMDSLCRQIDQMKVQGNALDPKVRARFNPLTWIAQQLLRRHPRCARTPRRQALYKNWKDWSDQERGRREMLRMRDKVEKVFNGFVLRGAVQRNTIPGVINAIDDTFKLGGVLKDDPHVQRVMGLREAIIKAPSSGLSKSARRKSTWFSGESWTFSHFWFQFASLIANHDIVPYSAIEEGIKRRALEVQERASREEAMQAEAQKRQEKEADQRRQMAEYAEIYEQLIADEHISSILNEKKILTGDDMRPGDQGFEFEVPPKGPHVKLLRQLLLLLGFDELQQSKSSEEGSTADEGEEEEWWTEDLADCWQILQDIHYAELHDGVVEKQVLEQVLVPPVGFMLVKNRVEDEFERRKEEGGDDFSPGDARRHSVANISATTAKPSFETLSQRLSMTMARIQWLHSLFESFLLPDEDAAKDGTMAPVCHYPDNPASIKKAEMRALIAEVNPDITEAEFEARFRRIDQDGNGMIEFDEFLQWVADDEVRIMATSSDGKMSFEELSQMHEEKIELLKYLHTCFQDQLPEGEEDDYPTKPGSLSKASAIDLLGILCTNTDMENFEATWEFVDQAQKGRVQFDQFLELVDFTELSPETMQQFT